MPNSSLQLTVYLIGAIFLPDSFKIAALEIAHNKVSPRSVDTPHDKPLIYVLLDEVSERIESKAISYHMTARLTRPIIRQTRGAQHDRRSQCAEPVLRVAQKEHEDVARGRIQCRGDCERVDGDRNSGH